MGPRLAEALKDSLISGGIALLIFGPITGLVLKGYEVSLEWERPLWMAAFVFGGRFLFSISGKYLKDNISLKTRGGAGAIVVHDKPHHRVIIALAILTAIIIPFILGKYWLSVALLALIYILLGLGLNIVVGLAGLLDLGFVAFYAVGAYGYALGSQYLGLSFWEAIPFCALLAASFGAMLGFPVLRMHGDYLAIVTLGFGEITRLVLNNWVDFTGGPNGIGAPFPTFFGLTFSRRASEGEVLFHEYFSLDYSSAHKYIFLYLVLLLVVCITTYFVVRLKKMPLGRAWEALREDEIACRSLGINHVTVKLSAFSIGAMVGGVGGAFFAASQKFVSPASFTFFESALILAIVVLGGMGSTVGVIIAAVVLTVLPEILRNFAEYRVLVFGIAMVLMMTWRPRGLLRIRRQAFKMEAK